MVKYTNYVKLFGSQRNENHNMIPFLNHQTGRDLVFARPGNEKGSPEGEIGILRRTTAVGASRLPIDPASPALEFILRKQVLKS